MFRIDLAYNYFAEKQLLGGNRELIQTGRLRYCLTPYPLSRGGWGGDSAYERGGDARRKFCIKPLKETDLGVAQAFFDP